MNKEEKLFYITGIDTGNEPVTIKLVTAHGGHYDAHLAKVQWHDHEMHSKVHVGTFLNNMLDGVKTGEYIVNGLATSILQYILCEFFGDNMWYDHVTLVRAQ